MYFFFKSLTNTFSFKNGAFFINTLFWLLLVATLLIQVFVFLKLNLGYIDSDQPFMWIGAHDYSKGLFYEPRFYAQDYNTFLEALVAVPFIWLGLPVYWSVPIATHILFLFPFLFTSIYLFTKRKKVSALLILALLICQSAEYDLMNSLPRGFVTGLFFTSFFVVNMLNPYNLKFFMFNVVMAMLGYFVNPNSVLVSAPFIFYIFLHHYKELTFYKYTLPLTLLLLPLHLFFNSFYSNHPDYVKHGIEYRFSTAFFWDNIKELNLRFMHISYFFENTFVTVLLVLGLLYVLLLKQNKKASWSFLIFIAVLLFSFCSGKTLEGSTWAYMSFSRMYLGIPVFIALFLSVIPFKSNKWLIGILVLPLFFSIYKIGNLEKTLEPHYKNELWVGVRLYKLDHCISSIKYFGDVCHTYNSPFLLVSKDFWLHTMLAYGGPAIYEDYPLTMETRADKRYWVREQLKDTVFKQFVTISEDFNIDKRIPKSLRYHIEPVDGYGIILVKNNTVSVGEFAEIVNAFEPWP